MARANDADVRPIIDDDVSISMAPFIAAANALTDYVDSCDVDNDLSTVQLLQIEIWLSAHFYAHRDQQYASKITERAEAIFQVGRQGEGSLDTTQWGRTAMILDVTGCLARLNDEVKTGGKKKVGLTWLGKAPSDQISYRDRD